jgi:dephospho-CoA kinase
MVVLGLTGSIGMGKSTTAAMFRGFGVPVHDSDATVHRLYSGEAAPLIEAAFPGVTRDGVVDRKALGDRVLGDPAAIKLLEAIVHPLVRHSEAAFLAQARAQRAPVALLDIPLLFETRGEGRVDAVVVVTAEPGVQRERVLARPGMTEQRFVQILARQVPDAEKRRRAHFIVDTGHGMESARHQVRDILRAIAGLSGAIGNA